jgi:predicted xylose isomerase-like sugar epimerase
MGLFTSAKAKLAAQKLAEEQLYEFAAEEIAANNIRPGLWAKAIAEADGEDAKAKARYIKLRVETMKAEAELNSFAKEEAAKTAEATRAAEASKAKAAAEAERMKKSQEQNSVPTKTWHQEEVDMVFMIVGLTLGLLLIGVLLAVFFSGGRF